MAAAFFVGKGYGEQTFFASDSFKEIAKTKEELNYTRSELENAKVKLQNIINGADRQKTDELLAQILQVFLADLGLQIQNRELILQQAKTSSAGTVHVSESTEMAQKPVESPVQESLPAKTESEHQPDLTGNQQEALGKDKENEKKLRQLKSNEWMLLNSEYNRKLLKKVTLKNFKNFLATANPVVNDCDAFIGRFKGSFKGQDGTTQGSITFELKNERDLLEGRIKLTWNQTGNPPLSTNISGNCGLSSPPLMARIFTLSDTVYVQSYPISNNAELTGHIYEKLPVGGPRDIGNFRLIRLSN